MIVRYPIIMSEPCQHRHHRLHQSRGIRPCRNRSVRPLPANHALWTIIVDVKAHRCRHQGHWSSLTTITIVI